MTTAPLLSVRGLTRRFGSLLATDHVDLDVATGELHAVIGPNGAGKTTLVAQLAGELQPDDGRVMLAGRRIDRLPPHRRVALGLARSFQIVRVFARLSVLENLVLACQLSSGSAFRFWKPARLDGGARDRAEQLLALVGLEDRVSKPAGNLPHGEQRRLDVALALASGPRLLLLDEPMAGMGAQEVRQMTQLIASLKGSVAMLLIEHDMDIVFRLADRVTVLSSGRVAASGPPDQVREDATVRQIYLGTEAA